MTYQPQLINTKVWFALFGLSLGLASCTVEPAVASPKHVPVNSVVVYTKYLNASGVLISTKVEHFNKRCMSVEPQIQDMFELQLKQGKIKAYAFRCFRLMGA